MEKRQPSTIIVKIGSNVIANSDGSLAIYRLRSLVNELSQLSKKGYSVVVVSSGAVAAGRKHLPDLVKTNTDPVSTRQVLAAMGQVDIINHYRALFAEHHLGCAQVLVTKEDFRDRTHYLNMRNCLTSLGKYQIIPVINENDVVAVTELMFTDNDELAGLVASMLNADKLIILTSVDGIFDGEIGKGSLLKTIDPEKFRPEEVIQAGKSQFGRGGMLTKSRIAVKIAKNGIPVHIINGRNEGNMLSVLEGNHPGTEFLASQTITPFKRWLAHSENQAKGKLFINEGAVKALTNPDKTNSLLPIGIEKLEGNFQKGDLVYISLNKGNVIGLGRSNYDFDELLANLGKHKSRPAIHYDYLYLY